jgi:chemotaxis protein MotB
VAEESNQPVIIVKKKGKGHGSHHGGAWKVAYADFVTAMMAFFLLMWLLNATTEEQRKGLADYFSNRGKTPGTGLGQAGWPRQRMTSARRGTAGALGTPSRAPR